MDQNQKQMLVVGGGAVGLLLIYRKLHARTAGGSGPTQLTSLAGTAGGGVQPYTPQSPITVEPGQSVYDPNSEGLLTPPLDTVPPDTSVFDPGGGAQIVTSPGQTQGAAPSQPAYNVNVNYPSTVRTQPRRRQPAQRPSNAPRGSRHTGTTPPGPNWRGIGGGWWAPPRRQTSKPKAGAK